MKIGIIGGGMAGLGAAYELIKNGHQVTVFEKGKTLGGLASSTFIDGVPIESFYHHMFPTYYDFFEIAEEIGVKDKIYFVPATTAVHYQGKLYRFTKPYDLLFFTPLSLFDRLKTGILILYFKFIRNWKPFEEVTATEWLKKNFGDSVYKILWKPLLESKFGQYADQVAMVWFWGRIYERPSKFGYFQGGFNALVVALENHLKKKGAVFQLNTEITTLKNTEDKKFIITHSQGEEVFDQVIVAAPPLPFAKIAGQLLPASYLKEIEQYMYVGTICAILVLKKHLTPYYWININDEGYPFVAIIDQTNFVPENTYQGYHPVYLSRYIDSQDPMFKLSEEELWARFIPALKKLIPSFSEDLIADKRIFRAPFTQPVVKTKYKKPLFRTPISGLWWVSMSHIYPWDRGTDHSFHAGRELARELNSTYDR